MTGAIAGTDLSFTDTPNGTEEPADFEVKVSAVQELTLPEADDEWVAANVDGFDTLADWRDAVR